ncbi:protein of unknown function [Pedobacter westerhofensis]|uniref:DUF4393 domain-containing protein n=1 Tax=Pedobacter westerhofensis TaxID=425512 RepID=A0A521F819_9SPHI|nr:DUF4393 domain-containing protein [Pedobacter westerhofensis]SMO92308.1 protein of unknown function [Pedobacter westerhofensis]
MNPEIIGAGAALTAAGKIKEDSLLGMMYKDVMQPSVQSLGRALGNTIEFCTTPLLLCKFGSEAAKLLYQQRMDELAEKLMDIPKDKEIPVNPQLGVPIMDKLTYTTNDEIADLFNSLLSKAASSDTVNLAHPAFIQIIERLSVDEARIIKYLANKDDIPCISFRAVLPENKGWLEILKDATLIQFEVELLFPTNTSTYIDNLLGLGILRHSGTHYKMDEGIYEPLLKLHNFDSINIAYTQGGAYSHVEKSKAFLQVTAFGKTFILACAS